MKTKMKSILKWITGIFLACNLILFFFTPFEEALTQNLILLYVFLVQFVSEEFGNSANLPKTYQLIFQIIYLLIFSGLIWINIGHGDMLLVIATVLSWLTVVCELWLLHYSQDKVSNS